MLVVTFAIASVGFVAYESLPFLRSEHLIELLPSQLWFPSEDLYGALALILGSCTVVGLATLLSIPLSWLAAIAFRFECRPIVENGGILAFEILSCLPPVIVGLFGLTYIVPVLGTSLYSGFGLFAAICVLTILLIPQSVIHANKILSMDLNPLLIEAKMLGLNRSVLLFKVIWPFKRKALIQNVIITISRGLAETLAILMVAGNSIRLPDSLFSSFRTINATIALEMSYAEDIHRSALFALGLLAFFLVWLVRTLSLGLGSKSR